MESRNLGLNVGFSPAGCGPYSLFVASDFPRGKVGVITQSRAWNIGPICCTVAIIIQLFGINWGKIEKSESLLCLALSFQHFFRQKKKKKIIMVARSPRLRRSLCLVSFLAATILKCLIILNKGPHFHFAQDIANSVTSRVYNVRCLFPPTATRNRLLLLLLKAHNLGTIYEAEQATCAVVWGPSADPSCHSPTSITDILRLRTFGASV